MTFVIDADRNSANIAGNVLPRFNLALDHARDPFRLFAEYRTHDPVHWGLPSDPRLPGLWYLFRHADCSTLFRLSVERPDVLGATPAGLGWDFGAGAPPETQSYFTLRKSFLTAMNDPDHARVRSVIAGYFTPKRVAEFRPRLEQIVAGLFDDIEAEAAATGGFDFAALLAHKLPLIVMSELMGVPPEDRDTVLSLSDRLMQGFDVDGSFDRILVAAEGAEGFAHYLDALFAARRRGGTDDVIGAIVAAADEDRMSEPELYGTISTLLQAGQSPAMGLLGVGTLGLLQQRDRFEELAADPDRLVVPATEELLRWVSPAQAPPPRWLYADVEIGGKLLRRGEAVVALIGAANRDPEVFPDPDRIDFTRRPNPHLAFGGGIHRCLGSTLARLEGQVVLKELVTRFPTVDLRPGGGLVFQDRHIARALIHLPLQVR
ncbi:cytochrome P450 [Dactylosporangium sucinum]|uniref:Polyketide biosynthesis cytochrome P450 PksS n=1 Tax=Dactylosporangium sucinum TaxID=1424081 RepID=A0A917TFT0_9ACTN|nr:cytochrome P450 [Dactylosporangium sucinum]GGM20748.1 polyketide biosynthesis cytochrome P450 PksS [Dactylosporangium sucinum]